MAKQTFTTGQVLTAAQMTDLQQTAMGGGAASTKTANYVLVAADAGTRVAMNAAGSTTITVNTSLFSAGDTVSIQNIGAGTCTITAGTASVNTSGSLALTQYQGGILFFTSASAALFFQFAATAGGGGGKVLQVVNATHSTTVSSSSSTFADTGLTATITPTLASSTILVLVSQNGCGKATTDTALQLRLLRGATTISNFARLNGYTGSAATNFGDGASLSYKDSPATTSATTYKTQLASQNNTGDALVQTGAGGIDAMSTITLLEIGA